MRKKILIISGVLFFLIIAGYFFIRYGFLKSKDFKPDTSKAKNTIDLRPSIIAKLQQLVKDGSNGLYILSIDKTEPDIVNSKLDVINAFIRIDTTAMRHLDSIQLLPDNIFTFNFSALHIDGIGIDDLLHKDRINISRISIQSPVINVYHKNQPYNEFERQRKENLSLYERLKGNLKKIAIGKIDIENAIFINHNLAKNKPTKFKSVSVHVNDLLIDSTTQHDKSRFVFAKKATIGTKNYSILTSDSLYFFGVGDISISGDEHKITALNVELKPRDSRQQFENKLHFGKDMYHLVLPKVILKNVNWQALVNNEKFISDEADIAGGSFAIFFDRSKPQGPLKINNFPHQALMKLPFPFSIRKINVKQVNFSYEEHNPVSDKNGTVYFDNLTGTMNNVSNISNEIKDKPSLIFSATAKFMHVVPFAARLAFNLAKHLTGEFAADIKIDSMTKEIINPIAEPLGMFSVKSGIMQNIITHAEGNNFKSNGKITMRYKDLHISPLKKDEQGNLKKKTVTGLLANFILIKNENPKGNDLRQPDFSVVRTTHKNFFNLLWKSILTGIVKTVGIPEKFAEKKK